MLKKIATKMLLVVAGLIITLFVSYEANEATPEVKAPLAEEGKSLASKTVNKVIKSIK